MNFEQDIIDLFTFKRGGHAQKWLYADYERPDHTSGSRLWHDFITSNKNYYPVRAEIGLIPAVIDAIAHNYDTVVDFGIGDDMAVYNKTIPILRSQEHLKRYYGIDISGQELGKGTKHIHDALPYIKAHRIEGDFYEYQNGIKGKNRLGLFLGTTISNQEMMIGQTLPYATVTKRLETLARTVRGEDNGNILISFDANPDLDHALAAYDHPSWLRMMTGLMYDVQSQLNPKGNFSPSLWHYAPVIDRDNHVLHQVISPSSDQSFYIGEKKISVFRGDQFVVKNNFKYPVDMVVDLVNSAGLEVVSDPIRSNEHPMVMLDIAT